MYEMESFHRALADTIGPGIGSSQMSITHTYIQMLGREPGQHQSAMKYHLHGVDGPEERISQKEIDFHRCYVLNKLPRPSVRR